MLNPVLNLITSPDKLFNNTPSLLLVNPSDMIKENFNSLATNFESDVNLYLYENIEEELSWLLEVAQSVDYIVLDIDNTKAHHWNRIYELNQFMEGVKYFGI